MDRKNETDSSINPTPSEADAALVSYSEYITDVGFTIKDSRSLLNRQKNLNNNVELYGVCFYLYGIQSRIKLIQHKVKRIRQSQKNIVEYQGHNTCDLSIISRSQRFSEEMIKLKWEEIIKLKKDIINLEPDIEDLLKKNLKTNDEIRMNQMDIWIKLLNTDEMPIAGDQLESPTPSEVESALISLGNHFVCVGVTYPEKYRLYRNLNNGARSTS